MKEYIERAAVLDRLSKVKMDGYGFSQGVQFGVDHAITCIKEALSADVVEVRHGRWIDLNAENSTGPLFKCSECSHLHNPNRDDLDLERVELKPLYCDACGARMDKEDEIG